MVRASFTRVTWACLVLAAVLTMPRGAGAGVDLRIESVVQTVPLPGPIVNQPIPLVVTVVNDGSDPAGPFSVAIWKDRTEAPTDIATADNVATVESLSPGSSLDVKFEVTYGSPGTYTLWVWADANNAVNDSNPANNQYTILLTVSPNLPDLIIDSIVPDTNSPVSGEPFNVAVTVRNQGQVDAGASDLALWKNREVPPMDPDGADEDLAMEAIAGGATRTVSFPVVYDAAGTYRLWVLADANRQMAEIDENNNTGFLDLTVGASNNGNGLKGFCGQQGMGNVPFLGVVGMIGLRGMKRFAAGGRAVHGRSPSVLVVAMRLG